MRSLCESTCACGCQHAHEQRFLRHFQREDADYFAVEDGSVLGDVHGQRGFAHRGARGDDDQIAGLEAAGHLVELGVVGGESGDLLAAGVEFVERAEGVLDDRRNVGEALAETVLGELEDALLGAVDDLFGFVGVVDGFGDGQLRDVDEAAQQRFVTNDADVVLDAGPVGNAVDERREVRNAADCLDLLAAIELLGKGDHVNRAASLLQIAHAREDAAMGVEREVVGLKFGGLIVQHVVEQDRAEDGALGFKCSREAAFQIVFGGRHRRVRTG